MGNHCEDFIDMTWDDVMMGDTFVQNVDKKKGPILRSSTVNVLNSDSTNLTINDFCADNALSIRLEPDYINHELGAVSFLVNLQSGISKVF